MISRLRYKDLWESNEREIAKLNKLREERERDANESLKNKSEIEDMEKKIEAIEEELKFYNKIKAENEKLKAENRALIRVVNKLNNINLIKS